MTRWILDESKWLAFSMAVAGLAAAGLLLRTRGAPGRRRNLAALTLTSGVTIGVMALGHLLAVSIRLAQDSLRGAAPALYALGAALLIPSAAVTLHAIGLARPEAAPGRRTVGLHLWLGLTLLALGLHNLPLAVPGFLALAYHLHVRRTAGRILLGAAVLANLALFAGALAFAASGKTFEELGGPAPTVSRSAESRP